MNVRNDLSRITIDITKSDHKKLKTVAAVLGKSMQTIAREAIEDRLDKIIRHVPNKETVKAIRDAEKGKGLTYCTDIDDLFKKLGI